MALPICLWLVTAFVYVYGAIVNDIDGGSTGDNGLDWVNGTPDTKKISVGVHCSKHPDTNQATAEMYAYQGDENFKFSDIGFQDGERVRYDICYLLDAETYLNSAQSDNATNCDGGIEFEFLTDTDDEHYGNWTMWKKVDFDHTDLSTIPCGGYEDNSQYVTFIVYCKREYGFDDSFDVIYRVEVGVTNEDCLVRLVSNDTVEVDRAPIVNVTRRSKVDMKVYEVTDVNQITDGPSGVQATGATELTSLTELGITVFLEICLYNNGNSEFFTDSGFSPIGVKVGNCYARPETTGNIFVDEIQRPKIVDSSCGAGIQPALNFRPSEHVFDYVPDTTTPEEGWLRSPNCFRSPVFELVIFQRVLPLDEAGIIYECEITYCNSTTGTTGEQCFGNGTTLGTDYTNVCSPDARRKRETVDEFPEKVSAVVYIKQNVAETVSVEEEQSGCFEKNTFIGLSSALAALLIVVLIVASYLAFRVWSNVDDNRSRSTDSMTGLQNKSYY